MPPRVVFLSLLLIALVRTAFGQADPLATATQYYKTGKDYAGSYKFDSAILFLEKAKALFATHKPDSQEEIEACTSLGGIYKYDLYNFDAAEKNYERALTIMEKISPADVYNLTPIYYNLATTNRSQHDHETAIAWCRKAIDGCLKLNETEFLLLSYSILGNIYRDMQRYDSAIAYYQKGIAANKGRQNAVLAGFYNAWGDTNFRQGDLEEAAKKLGNSVSIYQKVGSGDRSIYMHTLRLLAEVYIEMNELDKAYPHLQKTDELRKQLGIEKGGPSSALYKTFGDYFLKRKDTTRSLEYYQQALQATTAQPLNANGNPSKVSDVEFKEFAYDALLAKAVILPPARAVECFDIASNLMEASREELDTQDAKWNYVDANFRLYENALATLYSKGRNPDNYDVFRFIEGSKSKSLADAIHEAELKKFLGKDDTLLFKLQKLRQQLLKTQHEISGGSSSYDSLTKIAQRISAIEDVLNTRYPTYIKTKYYSNSLNLQALEALKATTKKLDAAFVEYFWGFDDVYAFVISGDSSKFYRLSSSGGAEEAITSLVTLFASRTNQYSEEAVAEFSGVSNYLYRTLIEPFYPMVAGRKRLVIVPDGPLIQVPFETLVTKQEAGAGYNRLPYLLNDHIISYSFSGYYFTNERKAPRSNPSLLAFGFTGGAEVRAGGESRPEIAGTETELLALSEKFSGGTFLYGADVTEKNFKTEAGNYDLLHLAVHGSGDTGEDYSATLHFRDAEGQEDGRLYWYELYGMNLRASLAVLSSCESGIGKTYRGEGMLSMANAFTFAGCSNVVMGLWKVDDQVSVKLMDTFYSELLEGMAIDEALALAKRTYLASADQVSANPKLWGSLVAYGEAQVVRPDELHTGWFVLALTVLLVGIFFLVRITRKK